MAQALARREQVNLRLSHEERRILERKAEISGVPVSHFLRELIVRSNDEVSVAQVKKALADACDISVEDVNSQAGALALIAHTASQMLDLRGYLTFKETGHLITQIGMIRGRPSAHLKITEESKSLNAHVHLNSEKTWEQKVEEAHGGGNGARDSSTESRGADSGILDVESHPVPGELVPGPAAILATTRSGRGRGSQAEAKRSVPHSA